MIKIVKLVVAFNKVQAFLQNVYITENDRESSNYQAIIKTLLENHGIKFLNL